MTVAPTSTSGWYADPYRRHEHRFYDGALWTEHVSDQAVPGIDTVPVAGGPRSRPPDRTAGTERPPVAAKERARVVPEFQGPPGDLLGAPVLVVDEVGRGVAGPAGLDCAVRDQRGQLLGAVRTAVEGIGPKALRMLTSDNHREVTRLEILDALGAPVLVLRRPTRLLKPTVTVCRGDGATVGQIVTRRLFTHLTLDLVVDGEVVGTADGDGPFDPNVGVLDGGGELVARVSRTWEVLSGAHHPEAQTHVVQVLRPLTDPLRSMAVATLLGLDSLLLQDMAVSP